MKDGHSSGTIVSIPCDGHTISALFYHMLTRADHVRNKPVVVRLHGIMGNLLDDTEHFLPGFLADKGYSSLTMNTLLANLGLFYGFGIFDDVIPQIDAACGFLRKLGFKKIVIAGHGLGGCMAVRYGALRGDPVKYPDIVGVIAIATPYSMPDTVRRRWDRFGSEPSYGEVYERARRVCKPGPGDEPGEDRTILVRKAHGETRLPEHTEAYTLKTWWALAGPEAEGAKPFKHIGLIRRPLLLVRAVDDDIIAHGEFEDLGRVAREAGNEDVEQFRLDCGHGFEGKHDELGKLIVHWLNERFEDG
jgi:pimeloyl-ACP methyl ester carboxylesterase